MIKGLIGSTGFVGSILKKQSVFNLSYNSTDIKKIHNQEFDLLVCAGAPSQKWIANNNPKDDRKNIESLIYHLKKIKSKTFILISTVDVFKVPVNIDETSLVEEDGLHPYGLHRRMLEKFVQDKFSNHLIVRLPGLVGPGLRKNVIFDLLNDNNLHLIESRGLFQFYPMVNLWRDIQLALQSKLKLIHLTAEPVSVSDISLHGFGRPFTQELDYTPTHYDMQTRYSDLFGRSGQYQYSVRETLKAIRAYALSEPFTKNNKVVEKS